MSFYEFLMADGKEMWVTEKQKATPDAPLFETLHKQLVETFRTYLLTGGMPASVSAWDYISISYRSMRYHPSTR